MKFRKFANENIALVAAICTLLAIGAVRAGSLSRLLAGCAAIPIGWDCGRRRIRVASRYRPVAIAIIE